ncbi:MAG TPA: NUMOD3 domain-containing DNA-binding protein [Rhizomicrobium sp.]|nr:NUMOD3 domain-containing DNA-binding protein [Rhizomicrobium sp.]
MEKPTHILDPAPIYYVYVLFRPWNGQPFYVGKGKGERWLQHEAAINRHPNKWIMGVIKKSRKLGLAIPRVKVREALSEYEALQTEIALIAAMGRKHTGGPLFNLTDGGEGFSNPSLEIRQKLIASQKRRFRGEDAKTQAALKTKLAWQDPEKRKRMMEARGKQVHSPETRAKIAKASASRKHTPEAREKISQSLSGHKPSEKTRALWSKQRKGRIHSPEYREKMKAIKSTPEAREANRKAVLAALTPAVRAKMSESAKAAFAKKTAAISHHRSNEADR